MILLPTLTLALVTGLTSGGFSCLAVQGGLLSSSLSKIPQKGVGLASFLISKLIAYTILGALLGALGGTFNISLSFQGWLQIAAGIYMLASAANLLNLHPIFRYTVVMPPKFLFKLLKNAPKTESIITPAIMGAFTVVLPCGITQSMMILALSSGTAVNGALIMGLFTIGTLPQFIAIGATASALLSKMFFRVGGAFIVAYLGLVSVNTGQILRGSPHTFQNYVYALHINSSARALAPESNGVQEVRVAVSTNGYQTSSQTLRAGVPVKLTLSSVGTQGCARAFSIPSLGITKLLPETGDDTLTFTPTEKGLLTYSCNMGMHVGSFEVI